MKNVYHGVDVYSKHYDYEDLKIALVIHEKLSRIDAGCDYEDIARLTIAIKNAWKEQHKKRLLSREEYVYIQAFASRYLDELEKLCNGSEE